MGKVQASEVLICPCLIMLSTRKQARAQISAFKHKGFSLQWNFNSQQSLVSYKLLHLCAQTPWTNRHVERSHLSISCAQICTEPAQLHSDTLEYSSTEKGRKWRLWQPSPAAGTGSWHNLEVAHDQLWLGVSQKLLKGIFLFFPPPPLSQVTQSTPLS